MVQPPLQVLRWASQAVISQPVGFLLLWLALLAAQLVLWVPGARLAEPLVQWALLDGPVKPLTRSAGLLAAGWVLCSVLVGGMGGAALAAVHQPDYCPVEGQGPAARRRRLLDNLLAAGLRGALAGLSRLPATGTVGLVVGLGGALALGCTLVLMGRYPAVVDPLGAARVWAALVIALGCGSALAVLTMLELSGLLALARIAAGDEPGRSPADAVRAMGRAVMDLVTARRRCASLLAALSLATTPLALVIALVLVSTIGDHRLAVRLPAAAVHSLCMALLALLFATGLRLGLYR